MSMVSRGLLVRLRALPDEEREVEEFLQAVLPLVRLEQKTNAWFALDLGGGEYGIFDAFPDDEAREAHLNGPVASALKLNVGVLFDEPKIQKLDILADKLPDHPLDEHDLTRAVLLQFTARGDRALEVEEFLRNAKPLVDNEPKTMAWFAVKLGEGEYGVFDAFPDTKGRRAHLLGRVPRELAKHAFELLGGIPGLRLPKVLAERVDAGH